MPRDLLAELQTRRGDDDDILESPGGGESVTIEIENNNEDGKSAFSGEMEEFRKKTQQVQNDLDEVRELTEKVTDIHAAILSTPDAGDKNEELEDVMSQVKQLASRTRAVLREVKQEAERAMQENPTSAVSRMKLIQQQALSKTFVDAMTSYNNAQMDYRDKCKQRIQRQLYITGKETSDEELEEMLETGNFDVFTQGIISETARTKQALADVEARHNDIMRLERSIRELRDMFLEMAVLVENQGEMINRIEYNVANAAEFVQKAKEETSKAREYQVSATKKKFWIIAIIAVVLLIIILWIVI